MILALLLATVTFLSDCKATFYGDFNFHAPRSSQITVLTQGDVLDMQGFVVWSERPNSLVQYVAFPWSAVRLVGTSSITAQDLTHPAPNAGTEVSGSGYMILWDGVVDVAGTQYRADQFNPKYYPPVKVML